MRRTSKQGNDSALADVHAILVPGGFGERGFEGKVGAARYARERNLPYLGICYGLHAAVIDFARNVAGYDNANSTEINPNTRDPVIGLVSEWRDETTGETHRRDGRRGSGRHDAARRAGLPPD